MNMIVSNRTNNGLHSDKLKDKQIHHMLYTLQNMPEYVILHGLQS